MHHRQRVEVHHVANGRRNVHVFDQVRNHVSPNPAWKTHDQRNPQRRIEPTMLLEPAVLAEGIAVICHVNDVRVVFEVEAAECLQDAADIAV